MNLCCLRCGGRITIVDREEAIKTAELGKCGRCGGSWVIGEQHRTRAVGNALRQLYLAWVNYGRAYGECIGGCIGDAKPAIAEPYEEIGRGILTLLDGPSGDIDAVELRRKTMANGKGHGLEGEEFR